MTTPTRVAVIDDHPLYLIGLERSFRMEQDFTIVSTGCTAAEACQIAVRERPDVLLLDIGIPGNGIKALGTISRAAPDVRVIMLTASDDEEHVAQALELGAQGYILKGVNGEQLAVALRTILKGETYVAPGLVREHALKADNDTTASPDASPERALSYRERQILELAGEGLTNKEISERINVPIRAIKFNLSSVFDKLGVKNRLEAILAYKWKRR
jgi:two-component system, NarL family, nitrate/nitrite response regulator NarL